MKFASDWAAAMTTRQMDKKYLSMGGEVALAQGADSGHPLILVLSLIGLLKVGSQTVDEWDDQLDACRPVATRLRHEGISSRTRRLWRG